MLGPFILELLKNQDLHFQDLSALAVSSGPGSYTGLRIGVSMAKAICYTFSLPLIAVDTLESLAFAMAKELTSITNAHVLLPMIDARRMEVYLAGFNSDFKKTIQTAPVILDTQFSSLLNTELHYVIGGNGAQKLKLPLADFQIDHLEHISFSSKHLGNPAYQRYLNKDFEDLAYFEPLYLKQFAEILKN